MVDSFRCNGKEHEKGQAAFSINRAPVLEYVSEQFLAHMGPFRRTQIVRTAGVDHTAEIEELAADVMELSGRLVSLRGPAADAVERQVQGLSDRLERLQAQPVIPPREKVVELDTTWADDWHANEDWTARRKMLLDVGARVWVMPGNRWTARDDRLRFELGTHVDREAEALEEALHQATL